ncbi:hypothetical protein TNCV_2774751 [Trichonephila clavipes]|nr:hypothetical protein TNCV_2774751 [Trichonephila clavipes]
MPPNDTTVNAATYCFPIALNEKEYQEPLTWHAVPRSHVAVACQTLLSYSYKFCSSKKCKAEIGKPSTYEVNTRLVYAMRCTGKGAEAARMFCGIMNLPPP